MQFGITADVNRRIGVDLELGVHSGKSDRHSRHIDLVEYLFGPRFSAHAGRATLYAHPLAGVVRIRESENYPYSAPIISGNGCAMAYGGGIDIDASDAIAIRVVQFDWIPYRGDGSWITNTIRFGFGVVFRAARK
jgi:hypothetical protein